MTSEPNVAPVVDDVDDSLNSDVVEDTIEPSTDTSATLRPSGKRTRKTVASGETVEKQTDASESTDTKKSKSQTSKKAQDSSVNPFVFVYTYLKQVVAELRKVIWPNRKQMITYTSIVLAFLIFMVILVAASDFGFTKLVMLVFGA